MNVRAKTLAGTGLLTVALFAVGLNQARGDYIYTLGEPVRLDGTGVYQEVNANFSTTEDNWAANSYRAIAASNVITGLRFRSTGWGSGLPVTPLLYAGNNLHDPNAGLTLVAQGPTISLTATNWEFQNVAFSAPVEIPAGQIFYAALFIPQVPLDQYPWFANAGSLIDAHVSWMASGGPEWGDPLDYTNILANDWGTHGNPGVYNPGDYWESPNLAIEAVAVPEPSSLALMALSAGSLAWMNRRRK